MQRLGLYALVLTLLALQAEAVSVSSFFSYGERVVPRGQTASSLLQLSNSFRYNGLEFNSIYVNSNGLISLGADFNFAPGTFRSDPSLIAPFWTSYNYSESGQVYFKESVDVADLTKATSVVRTALPSTLSAVSSVVVVTWENMQGIGSAMETNTFQCILATSGSQSYIIVYYLTGGMQLSGSPFAQVGLSWGDQNTTLPSSGTKDVLDITDTGNSGEEGLWVWRVDTIPTLPGVILGWDQTAHTVSEVSGSLQVCASVLSGMLSSTITASIVTGLQTADDDDYNVNNRQLSFFAQYTECITVTLENDAVLEDEEYATLLLQPTGNTNQFIAVLPRQTVIRIQDDDVGIMAPLTSTLVVSEEERLVQVCGKITDSNGNIVTSQKTVTVAYNTSPGTALENEDFSPAINRELVFVQTSTVCSTISVQNDETFENEEAFYFAFSNAFSQERISVDTSRVSVTIQDDDARRVVLSFDQNGYTVMEGGSVTTCLLMTPEQLGGNFSVTLRTRKPVELIQNIVRPATNGDDFAGNSIVLEFTPSNAGQQHCLTIPIIEDTVYEGEEIFGFEIYKDEALEVSVPKPRVVVRITDNDDIQLSLLQSQYEFNEGQAKDEISICVNRTGEMEWTIVVETTLFEGTANFFDGDRGDFTREVENIIFLPDATTACTLIDIKNDPYFETEIETFSVTVDYFDSLVSFTMNTADILIRDNDVVRIGFFFSDPTIEVREEGNAASTQLIISQSGQVDIPVSVSMVPVNGTATEHEDYEARGESIYFANNILNTQSVGERVEIQSSSISVTLLDDPVVEGDEQLLLQLVPDDPRVQVTQQSTVTVIIRENDEVTIGFTEQSFVVNEGVGDIEVCLFLRGYSTKPFTVTISTREVTAKEGVDFETQGLTIELPPTSEDVLSALYQLSPVDRLSADKPESSPQCATITIIDDSVTEEGGSKQLDLSLQTNDPRIVIDQTKSSATVAIQDDDFVTITLETSTISVSEDEEIVHVCARLSGEADFDINALFQTFPISAVAGDDYITKTVPIVFPAHITEAQCADFSVIDDDILENPEEFSIELRVISSSQVTAGINRTLTVVISDNDFVEVVFEAAEYSDEEGSAVEVCALMKGIAVIEVSALVSTRPSAEGALATPNDDYRAISNVTLFRNESISHTGLRRQCVSIALNDDNVLENTESFQVFLTSQDSVVHTTAASVADVYILDNDGVRMGIQEREYEVMEAQRIQPVCVELLGRIEKSISVMLSTSSNTATGGADYTSVRLVALMFQASESDNQTLCADFTVIDDIIYEANETFTVSLYIDESTTGVSVHIPSATVTIIDDDEATLRFGAPSYEVEEGEGPAQVCIELTGRTETQVECFISTQPATAQQGGQADYTFSDPASLVFPPSSGTSTRCAFISIVNDSILETTEYFTVIATSYTPRVIVIDNTSTVNIIDNDIVTVGFVELLLNVSEDIEIERSVTLCVELSGEIERNVTVTVATASSNSPLAIATANHDYVPLERNLEFSASQENKTLCVVVSVLDDRLVESVERFDIVVTSLSVGVNTPESTQRATVAIYDEDVVCVRGNTDTSRGYFEWPEAFPNDVVVLECINSSASRRCSPEGVWGPPEVESCYASVEAILKHVIKNLPDDDGGLSKEYLRELIKALHRLRKENPDGLSEFIGPIYTIFYGYSRNVTNGVATIDSETYELILTVVDILHFPEWPVNVVQEESVKLVRAVEAITEGLIKVDGFESLNQNHNFLGFSVEKGMSDEIFPPNELKRKTVTFVRLPDQKVIARLLSSSSGDEGTFLSSISLPHSIPSQLTDDTIGLYFGYYEKSVLFPIIVSNGTEVLRSPASHEVSPIIMATVSERTIKNLKESINYTISVTHRNYSDPICVSWDFSAVGGRGNWTTNGCKLESDKDGVVTCSCSHLTNFAVLLDVRIKPTEAPVLQRPILSTIVVVGVGISLLGLALTVITLLLFSKLRKRDSTVLRIQFCLSVALMLVAFVCGIARVEIFELCVSISALIHYFTLVALMWMAAEAVLMFQKLISATKTSVAYFVIASLICWLLPIPAVVVPIGIDRSFSIHQQFCFISHSVVFYASFLGPIAGILIFNLIMFFIAFIIILRYSTKQFRNRNKVKKRRAAVRTIFTILAVILIFGLTWIFGAFTVLRTSNYIEYLFVIFNSLQGLFIFLIFVVFAKETRNLWLVTCGCKKRKSKDGTYEMGNLSRRVSRNPSLRKTGDEIDSDESFDFDGADHLEALKALDREARLNMNSWDVMYIMPQNTFDIFLNSDQFQHPCMPMTASNNLPASSLSTVHAPMSDINTREDQSTADSGILVDQLKSSRSPKKLPGEPITTIEESETRSSYHIHSVSGIGYVSADSDDEFLDGASPPVLATPPSRRRSRAYGDRFKMELHNRLNSHEQDSEIEMVTSDFKIDIAQ